MEEQGKHIRLTSAEISQLWAQYMNDTASVCMLTYFLKKVEDEEIQPLVAHALVLSKAHVEKLTEILTEENNKVPYGFKLEEDVDLEAPRLFTDTYILRFIHAMANIGLTAYSVSLSLSVRSDITSFYSECLTESQRLYKMAKDLLLSKELFIRSPYIENLQNVEFVEKQGFLWDIIGDKRPLSALEITNIFSNIQRNALGIATLTGFSQVARSKDATEYFIRGIGISTKHIRLFGKKLDESYIAIPMNWDSEVTKSTAFTFSDKLMMFYTTALIALSVGYYGSSISVSPRVDLGVMYNRLSVEIQLYSEDGANIMINHRWLEQPPLSIDRRGLAKKNIK